MQKLPDDVLAALHDWYCQSNGATGYPETWTRNVLDFLREYTHQNAKKETPEPVVKEFPQGKFWHACAKWPGYSVERNFPYLEDALEWQRNVSRPSLATEENYARHCAEYGAD